LSLHSIISYQDTEVPFDKFVKAKRTLGTQMKATGEIMSIANPFEASLMKAIRSLELNIYGLIVPVIRDLTDEALAGRLKIVDDMRMFVLAEGLRCGYTIEQLYDMTLVTSSF
jgi:carbamoyl-phosphate synthase large subunit